MSNALMPFHTALCFAIAASYSAPHRPRSRLVPDSTSASELMITLTSPPSTTVLVWAWYASQRMDRRAPPVGVTSIPTSPVLNSKALPGMAISHRLPRVLDVYAHVVRRWRDLRIVPHPQHVARLQQ